MYSASKGSNGATRPNYIKYHLTGEASITLHFQPHHTKVKIENCSKSISVIKIATMKNMGQFPLHKGSHHMLPPH